MKTIANELLKPVKFIAKLVYLPVAVITGKNEFGTVTYEEGPEIKFY